MPVLDLEKKLAAFTEAMLNAAVDDSLSAMLELRQREKVLLAQAREEISEEVSRYKSKRLAEIKARESHRVTNRMTENKRVLLQLREESAKQAFDEAKEKIVRFTQSEDYLPHLKGLLQKAVETLGYGISAEVSLRPEDMKYADELLSSVRGVSLAFREGSFTLGGLCVYAPARGKQVDMSFDSAMTDMVGHFADMSGLRVEE